jgi:hypothetical protein
MPSIDEQAVPLPRQWYCVTETITKDGKIVAERHRHDNRLSMAVLHRLDKRCDRAAEAGARHLALVQHWDEWLALVGKGEEHSAGVTLEKLSHGQASQLPLGDSPTELDSDPEEIDLSHRFWQRDDGTWVTDFPPPADFTGYEECEYGDPDYIYERECTPEEAAILDADAQCARDAERAEEDALRVQWLEFLSAECGLNSSSPTVIGDPAHEKNSSGNDQKERNYESESATAASSVEPVDEPVQRLGDSLVDPEGEAVEQPSDHSAP